MVIDAFMEATRKHVSHRIWVVSDLQQRFPERARHCMTCAADDFVSLGMNVEAICYLGDATEGDNPDYIREMADMQAQQFARVDAPVYYALGNHDFDYFMHRHDQLDRMVLPFKEHMDLQPQWHTQGDIGRLYYTVDMGDYALCLLTDHSAQDGSWYTTHGEIRGDASLYPYTEADYRACMEEIEALNKPVFTLSHYSFAGGNRAAPLFDRFLPVPPNVRLHLYGHAHIGDAVWAGKDCHRKICAVDNQPLMQVNVASLENDRGSAIRSVILEMYDTGEIGVLFRNHSLHCWDDLLVIRKGDGERVSF